jgi:uncharacterized protein
MSPQLSSVEVRVLGCLIEKERTTPETYPLSLNSLVNACNQSTNRFPVVSYDEKTVETGLDGLRQKKLAVLLHTSGARVAKYRHTFLEVFKLHPRDTAILCVLFLRGAQTPGEIRARTERLCGSSTLAEIESSLKGLTEGDEPFITALPARPGQKEVRYRQLFSESTVPAEESEVIIEPTEPTSRLELMEAEIKQLRSDVDALREAVETLRLPSAAS